MIPEESRKEEIDEVKKLQAELVDHWKKFQNLDQDPTPEAIAAQVQASKTPIAAEIQLKLKTARIGRA